MKLIEVRGLEKTYFSESVQTPALRGVSFDIEDGEFAAIMGPSGSGKSTLLHILGFLDRHTRGTYRLEGKTFNDLSPDEIAEVRNRTMGFIFQAFNLLPRMTVYENVKIPLFYSDIPETEWKDKTLLAIKEVDMEHRMNYEPSRLSGGEKQRVAIARALVASPKIIFADEPTGNLDSKSGQVVMDYLQKMHALGRTVILITHETYTASYAERIIKLKDGQIEADQKVVNRSQNNDFKK